MLINNVPTSEVRKFVSTDGLSPYSHALETVQGIKDAGMSVGIVSNGSRVTNKMIDGLASAGLDTLTYSFHIHTKRALDKLVNLAVMTGNTGIVPTITMLCTNQTADLIPGVVAYTAEHGIPFATGLVQEFGADAGLSSRNTESIFPSEYQRQQVSEALGWFRKFGMVRTTESYLNTKSTANSNTWTCDPARDAFIEISATGKLGRCHERRTEISVDDISSLNDPLWRKTVQELVVGTDGPCQCGYECFYQAEEFNPLEYTQFALVSMFYKTGHASIAQKLGKAANWSARRLKQDINWDLKLQ